MDVFEAVRTVLAVRRYQDRPVPDEVIRRVVESGHLTGSSRNLQPWHFVVVQERETLRKLGELVTTGPFVSDAAFAIVVAYEKASPFGVSDASRAVQSMMLAAWGDGVGSNWAGFANRHDNVSALLGIPDDLDILAILGFGYPQDQLGRGKKRRKPLGDVAHRERFGAPFA